MRLHWQYKEAAMPFKIPGAIEDLAGGFADVGMQRTREAIAELNLLLGHLQRAGYDVGKVDIEIAVPPKITVNLKISRPVSEEKLNAILREQSDKAVTKALVSLLLRANQLRDGINVENLGLAEIQVVLTTSPQLMMSWKETAVA
jgi:hypothetical protein